MWWRHDEHRPYAAFSLLLLLVLLPLLSTTSSREQARDHASASVGRGLRQWPRYRPYNYHKEGGLLQKLGRPLLVLLRLEDYGDRPQRLRNADAATDGVDRLRSLVSKVQHGHKMHGAHAGDMDMPMTGTSRTGRALMQLNDAGAWYGFTFAGEKCPPCALDDGDKFCSPCDVSGKKAQELSHLKEGAG